MNWGYIVAAYAGMLAVLAVLAVHSRFAQAIDEELDAFEQAFPGRCPVCSHHQYGLQAGHDPAPPGPHDCPEEQL